MNHSLKSTRFLRRSNTRLVLEEIRRRGLVAGASLAVHCDLRPSTISNILKSLRGIGCLLDRGLGTSGKQGGKRPNLLSLDPDFATVLGVEVNGRQVRLQIKDFALATVHEATKVIGAAGAAEWVAGEIASLRERGKAKGPVMAIGCAGPSGVDGDLQVLLENEGGVVFRDEAAHLGAMAELDLARSQGDVSSLVFVDADTNDDYPCAIVVNGALHRGAQTPGRLKRSIGDLEQQVGCLTDLLSPDHFVVRAADGAAVPTTGKARSPLSGAYAVAAGGALAAWEQVASKLL